MLEVFLRHAVKQSRHWSIAWSVKLCWLLAIFQSDAASAHRRHSLVFDKHVPAFEFHRCLQALVHWCGYHAWCSQEWKSVAHIRRTQCDVLLLNQTVETVAARHLSSCWRLSSASRVRKSTELLWHKTLDFTPDIWHPNRPDLNPVDYRIWTVIQNAFIRNCKGRQTSSQRCGY